MQSFYKLVDKKKTNDKLDLFIYFVVYNLILVQLWPFDLIRTVECVPKRKELAPKVLYLRPSNVTILAKGDAIYECSVLSYPSAHIIWRKNGKKLSESNKKFRIIHGSNVSFLRVTDASYSFNNLLNITCCAENNQGSAEASAVLHVIPEKEKPRKFPYILISNPKSVEPDTLFKIECNVSNLFQLSQLQWYQSNRPINFDTDKYFSNFSRLEDGKWNYSLSSFDIT